MSAQYGVAIKKARTEDEYFNSDEEEEPAAYQPKPGSPGAGNQDCKYIYFTVLSDGYLYFTVQRDGYLYFTVERDGYL